MHQALDAAQRRLPPRVRDQKDRTNVTHQPAALSLRLPVPPHGDPVEPPVSLRGGRTPAK
ncbi:hypothetical protein GCM10023235_55160 [Kitasatospora terrestris]|uniref:Transposase n=1 Tax=Kitasatospora terrestris TaxID=258051 RepID=A0ABP9E7F5_9ACTN